jgi:hypothetical protein
MVFNKGNDGTVCLQRIAKVKDDLDLLEKPPKTYGIGNKNLRPENVDK